MDVRRTPESGWDPRALAAVGCQCEDTALGVACVNRTRLEPDYRLGRRPVREAVVGTRMLCGELVGCDGRVVALDLETTGLGGAGCAAFVVGLAVIEPDGEDLDVVQYVLADYPFEPGMLAAVGEVIGRADVLVTFNGRGFDWPLLVGRYPLNRLRPPVEPPHVDVLHPARRVYRERLENCRLQELERKVLGVERDDDIPSHLIPALYFDYLKCGRAGLLTPVLAHNRDDLVALIGLAGVIGWRLREPQWAEFAPDLAGVGRLLESLGRTGDSRECYELARGEHAGAARRLVDMCKRDAAYARAAEICREAIRAFPGAVWAYEELAKHLEHRERKLDEARELVRAALLIVEEGREDGGLADGLRYRLARLERKMGVGRGEIPG